uniref:Putative anion transporter 4, chloroplastic n=1 Tax=Anthurium amnicola TaxID=1678845 RepID=A0A1D1YFI3_9ARAE
MAVGAMISARSLGSHLASGKGRQTERAGSHDRKEHLASTIEKFPRSRIINKFPVKNGCYSHVARHAFRPVHHSCPLDKIAMLQRVGIFGKMEHALSSYWRNHFSENFCHKNLNQRFSGRSRCFLSSDPLNNSRFQQRKLDNFVFPGNQYNLCEHRQSIRMHSDFQSEQFEITSSQVDSFKSPEMTGSQVDSFIPPEMIGSQVDSLKSPEVPSEAASLGENAEKISYSWKQFPRRWMIVLLCFSAFLLCNMDRVNMSIAILPMSSEFNWNPATVGLIQSSFFWGYLLTQIIGGIWADKLGGKLVLGFGVVWWSVATVLTPIAARIGLPFLLVMRAFMGIGEGVAMPAMNNLLSKWIPVSERSRSLALVYSGMYLGSVTGLAFSPILIHRFGWPSVFYSFGSLGSIWFALWQSKAHSSPQEDPHLSTDERRLILGGSLSKDPVSAIPWRLILSKAPVWALIISHFCHNWGTFILLTWMPTYYSQVLKFNLTESGLFCVLPWLTMAVFANIGGWIADTLVGKGFSITTVRKIMQSIGFLGPAFFLTQLSHVRSPALAVLCMACSQGSDAFSQSGLYSNHQDIGPRYAGVLLGLSNTAGVLAGVLGTAATGYILQRGSWDDVFKVAVALYIVGTLVWNLFSTGEKILD